MFMVNFILNLKSNLLVDFFYFENKICSQLLSSTFYLLQSYTTTSTTTHFSLIKITFSPMLIKQDRIDTMTLQYLISYIFFIAFTLA